MKETYLTKEELIQFLKDHEVSSIRIVSEDKQICRGDEGYYLVTASMIDIVTTGKKEKKEQPIYKDGWVSDMTGNKPLDKWDGTIHQSDSNTVQQTRQNEFIIS